jgi:hypothetical protein
MILDTTRARVTLTPGRVTRLQLRAGTRLRGVGGTSWVTLDGDPRDIVLERGEELVVEKDARALACSLGGDACADLQVDEPQRSERPLGSAVPA